MIEWNDTFWDGDWLLIFEAGEPERYTIAGGEARSGRGAPGTLEVGEAVTRIRLAAGRTISLSMRGATADQFSATVNEAGPEGWSEPAMWKRA